MGLLVLQLALLVNGGDSGVRATGAAPNDRIAGCPGRPPGDVPALGASGH